MASPGLSLNAGTALDVRGNNGALTLPTFLISTGSLTVAGEWRVAHDQQYAFATISGGTINQTASNLQVGYNGASGLVTFTGNAVYNQGSAANIQLDMGPAYGSNAQVVVSGSANVNFGQILVGDYNNVNNSINNGLLTVAGNAQLTGTSLVVGNTPAPVPRRPSSGGSTTRPAAPRPSTGRSRWPFTRARQARSWRQ